GSTDFMQTPERHMATAAIVKPVYADQDGNIHAIATRELGLAVIELGGGRRRADDKINHAVGLSNLLGKNAKADRHTPLAIIHAADESSFSRAAQIVKSAYTLGTVAKELPPILETITS
ncbi:MAG: thymidine phosphorylase, partial [Aestuariivirga sp.]